MINDVTGAVHISSKEILEKAGISRATLNNYIKLGIIPKPFVKRPEEPRKNIKSLGYFPEAVLDTLREVKSLKKKGWSMDSIAMELGDLSNKNLPKGMETEPVSSAPKDSAGVEKTGSLTFSLEGLDDCAYLLNFDFEIAWMNRSAERDLFYQMISRTDPRESRNIFHLLFRREFRYQTGNWKDLIRFHMSFAKFKYARTWLKRLYRGISDREVHILESIYDDTQISHDQSIQEAPIELIKKDGSIVRYSVFSIFFNEGILFMYKRR